MTMHYESFRREYIAGGLSREMLDASPIRQFETWLEQAVKAGLKDRPQQSLFSSAPSRGSAIKQCLWSAPGRWRC